MSYVYEQSTAKPCLNSEGAMIPPPESLDYNYLLRNRLPIYVLYNIAGPMSNLTLTVRAGQQGPTGWYPLRIPRSKKPFCVTDKVQSYDDIIKGCRDLWNVIDKTGMLLMWPSHARDILGEETVERKVVSEWSASALMQSARVKEATELALQSESVKATLAGPEAPAEEPTHPRVMSIAARVESGELKQEAAQAEYDAILEDVTDRDIGYAITATKAGKLRDWLQAQLAKRVQPANPAKKDAKPAKAAPPKMDKLNQRSAAGWDDDDSDLSPEDKLEVAKQAALARSKQRL